MTNSPNNQDQIREVFGLLDWMMHLRMDLERESARRHRI